MHKKFFYLSGLQRSGSTVLGSILSQNPNIYVSPTSPLLDLVKLTDDNWSSLTSNIKNKHPEQILNVFRGLFDSLYEHTNKSIIIDKNRYWPVNTDLLKAVTKESPKIIVTVRDISEILASLLTINRKNDINIIDNKLKEQEKFINDKTRCEYLWNNFVSIAWNNIKICYDKNKEYMYFVEYNDIVNNPEQTLTGIYNFLEIKPYKHNFNNIFNHEPENDFETYAGLSGLHDVRPVLKCTSLPAEQILGKNIAEQYNNLKLEFWRE